MLETQARLQRLQHCITLIESSAMPPEEKTEGLSCIAGFATMLTGIQETNPEDADGSIAAAVARIDQFCDAAQTELAKEKSTWLR